MSASFQQLQRSHLRSASTSIPTRVEERSMPFVRRRPLLRAAAIGGVAYMGAKAGTNRAAAQQQAAAGAPAQAEAPPPPAPAPAAPVSAATDRIAQLQQLASLHDSGALTDEEFTTAKAQVLA
jgi:Short C-terminal domain